MHSICYFCQFGHLKVLLGEDLASPGQMNVVYSGMGRMQQLSPRGGPLLPGATERLHQNGAMSLGEWDLR